MNARMILGCCGAVLACAVSVGCVDDETVPARPTTATGSTVVVSHPGVTNAQPAPAPQPPVVYNVVQPTPPPSTNVTVAPQPAPAAQTTTTTTTAH